MSVARFICFDCNSIDTASGNCRNLSWAPPPAHTVCRALVRSIRFVSTVPPSITPRPLLIFWRGCGLSVQKRTLFCQSSSYSRCPTIELFLELLQLLQNPFNLSVDL